MDIETLTVALFLLDVRTIWVAAREDHRIGDAKEHFDGRIAQSVEVVLDSCCFVKRKWLKLNRIDETTGGKVVDHGLHIRD